MLGQTTNSFYLQADMASCLGPLKAASTTPADGVSVVTFTGCGSPSSLREIYSLGALPTQANSQCLQIKGHQSASTARYYQLYGTGDGKVSGKWMCETEACETCLTEFNNVIIGKAGAEAQCDNYHQVWQSDALTPCGQSCSCDPPPPPSPPPSPAPGPSPAPPPRFVYINQYIEEDSPVVDCRVGNSWQEIIISRLHEGCQLFTDAASEQDTYRLLEFDRGGRVQKLGLYCGVNCSYCQDYYANVGWGQCLSVQDETSAALYPMDNLCRGSTNVELARGGITLSTYESGGCEMDGSTAENNVLSIRGYPSITNQCERDGITKYPLTYYSLQRTTNSSGSFYNGYLECSASDCDVTSCRITVKDWRAGQCSPVADGRFMQINPNEDLQRCQVPPPGPGPGPGPHPTTDPPTLSPQAKTDEVAIAASLGVVLVFAGVAATVFYFRGSAPKRGIRTGYETISGQNRGPGRGQRRGRSDKYNERGTYDLKPDGYVYTFVPRRSAAPLMKCAAPCAVPVVCLLRAVDAAARMLRSIRCRNFPCICPWRRRRYSTEYNGM